MSSPTIAERSVTQGSVHLDALRGSAAMLVFLNHTRALYFSSALVPSSAVIPRTTTVRAAVTLTTPQGPGGGLKMASEAVIIFFVLSGYLVGGSVLRTLRQNAWSWKEYLVRRLTRLWVPLIPCLLLCYVLDHAGLRLFGSGSIYGNPPGIDLITSWHLAERLSVKVLLGNLLFLQGILVPYFGTDNSLWSLANEFWYYLVFPCLALAAAAVRPLWMRLLYLVGGIALLAFITRPVAHLFPIWLLGAIVAMLPRRLSPRQASLLSFLGFSLLLLCMYKLRTLRWSELLSQYILAIATSLFVYVLIQQSDRAPKSVYRSVANFLSLISYTLYIVHLPLAIFLASMVNSPWHQWEKTPQKFALYLLLDGVVLASATLLWRLFEANTDYIRRWLFERAYDPVAASTTRLG